MGKCCEFELSRGMQPTFIVGKRGPGLKEVSRPSMRFFIHCQVKLIVARNYETLCDLRDVWMEGILFPVNVLFLEVNTRYSCVSFGLDKKKNVKDRKIRYESIGFLFARMLNILHHLVVQNIRMFMYARILEFASFATSSFFFFCFCVKQN